MAASLVEINWHGFLIFRLTFCHVCSDIIETFQERAVNDASYRSVERFSNVSMMF